MNEEKKVEGEEIESTNELKKETVNTVKQVKDTVKSVNFKEETKKTRGITYRTIQKPNYYIKKYCS